MGPELPNSQSNPAFLKGGDSLDDGQERKMGMWNWEKKFDEQHPP